MKKPNKSRDDILSEIYLKALNFVSYRPRTESEIKKRLDKYLCKYSDELKVQEVSQEIFTRLKDEGFVDDQKYCDLYVSSVKPKSKKEIKYFLFKKGVQTSIIEDTLKKLNPDFEENALKKLIQKKFLQIKLKNYDPRKAKLKMYQYFVSKGYPFSEVKRLVDTLVIVK